MLTRGASLATSAGRVTQSVSAGPRGPQGDTGPQGVQGLQGDQGPQGDTGPQGAQGAQGLQGDTGSQGAQGSAASVSTASINDLSDVYGVASGQTPIENQVMLYKTSPAGWHQQNLNLAMLADVNASAVSNNHILLYVAGNWFATENKLNLCTDVDSVNWGAADDTKVLTYAWNTSTNSGKWTASAPSGGPSLTFIRYYVPSALTIPLDFPSSVPDQISHVNESPRLTPLPYVYNGTGNASDAAYRYPRSRTGGIYSPVGTTIAWPAKPWHPINYWRSMDDATTPKEYITIPSNGHYEVFFRIQLHVADQGSGTSHLNRVILKVEMTRGSTTTVTDAYMEYIQEGSGTMQQDSGFHHGTFITQDVIELQQNDQLRALWMFSLVPNRQAYVGVPTTFYVKRIG